MSAAAVQRGGDDPARRPGQMLNKLGELAAGSISTLAALGSEYIEEVGTVADSD